MQRDYDTRDERPLLGLPVRHLPSNGQAEEGLLGALLANNKTYDRIAAFLTADMFFSPANARIFQSIARRIEAGQAADAVTLKAEYENAGILDQLGGTAYLTRLITAMVAPIMAAEYGRTIQDAWLRRKLIEHGETIVNAALGTDPALDGALVAERAADDIDLIVSQASAGSTKRRGNTHFSDAVHAAVDRMDDVKHGRVGRLVSTGLPCIDRALGGGVATNTFNYMVGASEAGKTELALQIAEGVAVNARRDWLNCGGDGVCPGVLYIVMGDMTADQLAVRSTARLAGVTRRSVARGDVDVAGAQRLLTAREMATEIPIEFSDSGPSTVARILGDIRRFKARRPLVMAIVDNFSDLLSVSIDKMFGTAIAATKALKDQGAKDLNTSILLLMHTNSSKERDAKGARPTPADVPWNTKKDAHFAFGVYRPFLYLDPSAPKEPDFKNDHGKEAWAKIRQKWQDSREPYPIGVRDVTEIVPMKLREADDDNARDIGMLRFDRSANRFIDVKADEASRQPIDLWDRPQ